MGEMGEGKKKWRVGVVKLLFAVMLGMILIPSLILAVQPAGMKSQTAEVSIQDATVAQGETVEVPINITDVTDLAATTIWLSYDSSVVTVEEVREGTLGSLAVGINNTAGVTKMSWFSMTGTGKTGDFVFAYVRLKAVGSPGDESVLDLDVKNIANSEGKQIDHTVSDGMFSVKAKSFFVSITPSNITVNKSETVLVDVRDADTGEPVEGATVDLSGCGVEMSKTTNASGIAAFEVNATSTGNITVTVSKTGYKTWTKEDGIVVRSALMEGDVNMNGCVGISDAMLIAQYTAGLRTLNESQLKCADTDDDGDVDILDAMLIAQYTVDSAYKPLWESPADEDMLMPVPCT